MKIQLLLTALLLTLGVGAREIVLNYEFLRPELLVRDGRTAVSVADCQSVGAVGEPVLPVWTRLVALADGEIVTKVAATLSGEDVVDLEAPLEYARAAYSPFMTAAERAAVQATDVPNAAIFSSDEPWPATRASCAAVEFLQTYPVVSLRVFPVRYLPNQRRLAFATHVTVTITCENSDLAPRSSLRRHVNRRGEVMEKVDNPNDVPRPPLKAAAPTATDYDLLFITTAALKPGFGRLFDFYASRGLKVRVLTMEEIDETYRTQFDNSHRAGRVRQAVKDAYNASGVRYVVLGGDAGEIPGANLHISIQNLIGYGPCDQFYSCLEDWSYTENTKGEINTDDATPSWTPTVYVGRYPVRNQAEIDTVVDKVLAHVADTTDYNRAILAGTCLNTRTADNSSKGSYGGNSLDLDWETLTAAGYDVVARFSDRPLAGGKTWNAYDLADAINANDPRILVGMGHGLQQEAFGTRMSSLTDGFWRNRKPFFATSGSCQWCAFHGDCFGEYIVRLADGGAWGVAGSVWDGWYSYGDESAYSAGLVSTLLQEALNGGKTIGEAFGDAKAKFMQNNNTKSTSNCFGASAIVFTLLADPTVALVTEKLRVTPLTCSLDFDSATTTYPSVAFRFQNRASSSGAWELVEKPDWLDAASTSGAVAAGGSASVTVRANAAAKRLPCGNNLGYVRFRIGGTTVSRKVNLFVSHSGLGTISATGPATMYRDLPSVWNVSAVSSYNGGVSLVGVKGTASESGYLESDGSSFAGTIPLTSASAYRHQMIYHHAGFGNGVGLGAGLIQKIRFRCDEGVTFSSVTLRMKHIPWDSWSYPKDKRSTMDDDGFVTVYSRSSSDAHDLTDSKWIDFTLDHPFLYNGRESFVVDLTAQVEVPQSAKKPDKDKDKDPVAQTKTVYLKTIGSYGYTTRSKTSSVSASYVTPCTRFSILPVVIEPQTAMLSSGAGSMSVTPRTTTAASYYLTDGCLSRGAVATQPAVRDWRLKWIKSPSGSVAKDAAQPVAVEAVDFTGQHVTAANGVEAAILSPSTGAFIEIAPTATANDLLTRQFTASRVQASYPAALLGGRCRLKSVSIWVEPSIGESVQFDRFTVRAQCRTTGMTNKSYDYLVDGWTTVRATGSFDLPTKQGWVEIPFDAPFEYDGVNDLLLDISYTAEQNYNQRALIGYCDVGWTSGVCIRTYLNSAAVDPGDPLEWTVATLPSGANRWGANRWLAVRFNLVDAQVASATPSTFTLTDGVWSGSLTPLTAGAELNLCASFAGAHTAVSSPFTVSGDSGDSGDPTDPVDPPTDPVDPPVDPTDPVDPPVDPTDPVDPSVNPVDPYDASHSNATDTAWFDVRFANYAVGSSIFDGMRDPVDGGTWLLPGDGDAVTVASDSTAEVVATNAPFGYRPSAPSADAADASIVSHLRFSVCGNEKPSIPSDSQAAITVAAEASGAPCYQAWDGAEWVKLVNAVPSDDFVEVKIEFQYAKGCERCVRYTVDGTVLATEEGESWLPAGGDARHLSAVGVSGRGAVGDVSGRYFEEAVVVGLDVITTHADGSVETNRIDFTSAEGLQSLVSSADYGAEVALPPIAGDSFVIRHAPGVKIRLAAGQSDGVLSFLTPGDWYSLFSENGVAWMDLNDKARPEIGSSEAGRPAFVVTDDAVLIRVTNVKPGLRYGLRQATELSELSTAEVTDCQVKSEGADDIVLSPTKTSHQSFYRIVVTDRPLTLSGEN